MLNLQSKRTKVIQRTILNSALLIWVKNGDGIKKNLIRFVVKQKKMLKEKHNRVRDQVIMKEVIPTGKALVGTHIIAEIEQNKQIDMGEVLVEMIAEAMTVATEDELPFIELEYLENN